MSKKSIFLLILSGCIILILVYGFLWGPLFPFSPIKPGYAELKLSRCRVFYPQQERLSDEYLGLDRLMTEAEVFHHLKFKEPVRVIACETNAQYNRMSLAGGHACAIQTGTLIYIRPSIRETTWPPEITIEAGEIHLSDSPKAAPRDLTGFLKHELSHALLYQNTSMLAAMKINSWLEEGIAICFGNVHHYFQGEAFRILAIDQGYLFNLFDDDSQPKGIPSEIKHSFRYAAYGAFMNYLIQTHGQTAVLAFINAEIKAPETEARLFKTHFGCLQDEALARFRKHIEESEP